MAGCRDLLLVEQDVDVPAPPPGPSRFSATSAYKYNLALQYTIWKLHIQPYIIRNTCNVFLLFIALYAKCPRYVVLICSACAGPPPGFMANQAHEPEEDLVLSDEEEEEEGCEDRGEEEVRSACIRTEYLPG